eukprot:SM000029S10576  [mRNA]  locus=s29:810395:811168:- [translate_table: standard]
MGAAYGTAKSGVGVASMGVMRPELVMKSIVPVVMAGVLGIYGLIIAVIIATGINPSAKPYFFFDGYAHLSSGLSCGLAGLSAGMAIGIVGDAGVRYVPPWTLLSRLDASPPVIADKQFGHCCRIVYALSRQHTIPATDAVVNQRMLANAQQPKLFVGMILILIFAEALALYGLIVGIILSSKAGNSRSPS